MSDRFLYSYVLTVQSHPGRGKPLQTHIQRILAFVHRAEAAYHQGDTRFTVEMRKLLLGQLVSAALEHMQGRHDQCMRAVDPRRDPGGIFELLGYDCRLWDPDSPEAIAVRNSRKAKDTLMRDPGAIEWMRKYLSGIANNDSIIVKGTFPNFTILIG